MTTNNDLFNVSKSPDVCYKGRKNWKDFLVLEEEIASAYYLTLEEYRDTIWEDVLSIGAKKLVDIANCIYFQKKKIVYADTPLTEEESSLRNTVFSELVHYNPKFFRSTKNYLLRWFKGFFQQNRSRLSKVFKKPFFYNQYSISKEGLEHVRSQENVGLIIPYFIILKKIKNVSDKSISQNELTEVTSRLVHNIKCTVSLFDIDSKTETLIVTMINEHHRSFYGDYLSLRNSSNLPSRLVLCSNSKTHVRMISQAMLRQGKTVIGCTHGEPLVYEWSKIIWMELILCSIFLEYTPDLAKDLERSLISSKFKLKHNPIIKPLKEIYKSKTSYSKPPSLKHIKNAVLVGNAYLNVTFSSVSAFEPLLQMDIEATIIKQLSDLGVKVDYKKHPGGLLKNKIDQIYSDLTTTLQSPFEDIIDNYDLVIFYYTRTSTITRALASNKNILIVDLGFEALEQNSQNLLNQRCFYSNIDTLEQDFQKLLH